MASTLLTSSRLSSRSFQSHTFLLSSTASRCFTSTSFFSSAKPGSTKHADSKEFSNTMLLPKTAFNIRANAADRDRLFYNRTCQDLYQWQQSQNQAGDFVFHDGPPYANGHLHCGHALNKILKDISNRYQVLQGKRVHFMPGWDCHGLPIETKALAKFKDTKRDQLSAKVIRQQAKQEAVEAIELQKQEFQQFGIMADWSQKNTYRTLDPKYEARQLRVFGEMVKRNLIYRQYRPVYWSPSNRTALAESELEYNESHISKTVYVIFQLIPGPSFLKKLEKVNSIIHRIQPIIWTTTPWTLASNSAINVNPEIEYSVVGTADNSKIYLIAAERIKDLAVLSLADSQDVDSENTKLGPLTELARLSGQDLLDSTYRTPLMGESDEPRPILSANYVTPDSGTGLVHSAPAHGAEDYEVWKQAGYLEKKGIFSPLDDYGRYNNDIRQLDNASTGYPTLGDRLIGKPVLTEGTDEMINILREKNALISVQNLRHRYPYDWRSKLPIIVRATSQWFANLDKIENDAMKALEKVRFVPESSRIRLESFIKGRSEWCISRQRVWGVPIPVVYDTITDQPLLTADNIDHIASLLETRDTDYWWEADAEEFVAPQYRQPGQTWRKGLDTVDVWFDSGTSWMTCKQELPEHVQAERQNSSIADVYLEGSDQHRGWFQSSLLTAVATTPEGSEPKAPFKTVVTHGYVLDKDNRKMSKSLGNTISPLSIIQGDRDKSPAYGIDVLRLWAAKSDYTTDLQIGSLIVDKTSEILRKVRNTARFMLANLPEADQLSALDRNKMNVLDRFVMHQLYMLERTCSTAYESYDFAQVVRRVTEFTNATLSSLYLDIAKDFLYVDSIDSPQRQSMISVIDHILRTVTSIMAPITPFLAEDIHHYRLGAKCDPKEDETGESVFVRGWQKVDDCWRDDKIATEVGQTILKLRSTALALIEEARKEGHIKTSFEVEVDLFLQKPSSSSQADLAQDIVSQYADQLTQIFNVARVNVVNQASSKLTDSAVGAAWIKSRTLDNDDIVVRLRPSTRFKCTRCRTYRKEAEEDRLCQRCEDVVCRLTP